MSYSSLKLFFLKEGINVLGVVLVNQTNIEGDMTEHYLLANSVQSFPPAAPGIEHLVKTVWPSSSVGGNFIHYWSYRLCAYSVFLLQNNVKSTFQGYLGRFSLRAWGDCNKSVEP